jgi:rod shape-determining protein MreC
MNAITATRRTIRREWTAFGALLIISVGMMGVSGTATAHDLESGVNTVVSPVARFVNSVADTAGSYWSALTQIDRLRTQIEQLRQENLKLQEELDRMGAVSQLNDDWTQITTSAAGVAYQTTPVRVIVRDISGVSSRTLIVDKGSNDGLVQGQVVIDSGGALVGRVSSVDATVSKILLISDPSSTVVGKETKSGAKGTVRGLISGQLQMSGVDVTPEVAKTLSGKSVFTAGESLPGANSNDLSPFPPGLLIGKIVDVSSDPNAVVQSATITPSAHLTDATFLLVITNYRGGFGATLPTCASSSPGSSGSSGSPGSSHSPGSSRSPGSSVGPGASCVPAGSGSPSIKPTATTGY